MYVRMYNARRKETFAGDPADAGVFRLPNGDVHAVVADDGAQKIVAVHPRRGRPFAQHLRLAVPFADAASHVVHVHLCSH